MVRTLPYGYEPKFRPSVDILDGITPVFVIHPSTSELAETLVIDPKALEDENYSGVYDAEGDYIPQYCDNPDDIPRGALQANPQSPATGTEPLGGAQDPNTPPPSSDPVTPSNGDIK